MKDNIRDALDPSKLHAVKQAKHDQLHKETSTKGTHQSPVKPEYKVDAPPKTDLPDDYFD